MHRKSSHFVVRTEHALLGVMIGLVTAVSAVVGAAAAYRPHTEQPRTVVVVDKAVTRADAVAPAPVAPRLGRKLAAEQLIVSKILAEHRCLSDALYYEARGEGLRGEKAVAEVIFRRMHTGNYGNSICAVVYEGSRHAHCQFSFACSNRQGERRSAAAWTQAATLAARIFTGEERLGNETLGATSFHAADIQPDWAGEMVPTVQIGNHIFYKRAPRSRAL